MSGNSSKKKQEEKNLKTLREFLALPSNKTCFDCAQRGPTYVNATIGSYVCVSCSGKLRGLTPPHRVKSVTMASFTQEEIDFLRSRGNEYCRLVWMSHYNLSDLGSETKDDQKFKDHLVAKYEKKRWYADPGTIPVDRLSMISKPNGVEVSQQQEHVPVAAVTRSPLARPTPAATSIPTSSSVKSSDLLADLDFFTTARTASSTMGFSPPRSKEFSSPSLPQSTSQPSFANFQNADFFFPEISPQKGNVAQPVMHHNHQAVNGFGSAISPPKEANGSHSNVPPEDRYSALKDLDALFTTTQNVEPVQIVTSVSSTSWAPTWTTSVVTAAAATAPAQATTSHQPSIPCQIETFPNNSESWNASLFPPSSNPFLVGTSPVEPVGHNGSGLGRPALPWANFSTSPVNGHAPGHNNLLGATHFPSGNHFGYNGHHVNPVAGMAAGLTSSQSLDLSPKTWGTSSSTMNPFMDATTFTQSRSHNPFL